MTMKQAQEYIGKEALMRVPLSKSFIQVRVKITDARHFFGRDDVFIQPVMGIGAGWVSSESVELCK
jgi:hypothetical protein